MIKPSIHKALRNLFRHSNYELLALDAGKTNQSYKLTLGSSAFSLRINNDVIGVDREQEQLILEELKTISFSPTVAHHESEFTLFNWENGASESFNSWNKCQWNTFFSALETIHKIQLDSSATSVLNRLELYESRSSNVLSKAEASKYKDTRSQLKDFGFFEMNHLIHCDLNSSNLLWDEKLKVLDWEFAGRGHPLFDFAVIDYYAKNLLIQQKRFQKILLSYENGKELFELSCNLVGFMMKIWEAAATTSQNLTK